MSKPNKSKVTTPKASNPAFQPIALLPPTPREAERVRNAIASGRVPRDTELCFAFSSVPSPLWNALFSRAWRLWFPDVEQPYPSNAQLIVKAPRPQVLSRFEMATLIVNYTNQMCAPLSRGREAQAKADQTRKIDESKLAAEHAKPVTLPNDHNYEVMLNALDRTQFNERQALAIKHALAEFDNAMFELAAYTLDDVMSRTKRGE